jgi:hypothetical protein
VVFDLESPGELCSPNARNPKEAEAPLGCSPRHVEPFGPRIGHSASGVLAMSRSSEPEPWGPSTEAGTGGAFTPATLRCSFGRIRCRTLAGFYADPPQVSLWRPHRVAPLRTTYIATRRICVQAESPIRFRAHNWFSRTSLQTGVGETDRRGALSAGTHPTRKTPRKLDRSLALSGFAPKRRCRSSPVLGSLPPRPGVSHLSGAEALFDPRPHFGAEAPRCVPVRNRGPVQIGDPPEGFSPVTS